jgi:heterotetrameric sarcosine oxidase delta subunit
MLQIKCPWCGSRAEKEFSYGGDAKVSRPGDPQNTSDQEWLDYVYFRDNPRGKHLEYWQHSTGCRRWFKAVRDTYTNEFIATGDIQLSLPRDEQ